MAGETPIATTYVTLLPETSRIAAGVQRAFRAVDSEARNAGKRWGREIERGLRNIDVGLTADVPTLRRSIERGLRGINTTIALTADTTGLRRRIETSLRGMRLTAMVELDADFIAFQRRIDTFVRLVGLHATVELDADVVGLRARILAGLAGLSTTVHVNSTTSSTSSSRDHRVDVIPNMGTLTRTGGVITKVLAGAVAAGLVGLTATGGAGGLLALTGAIAPAVGAIGLIPAAAGTAALAIGSLKLATSGFADALKDIRDPEAFAESILQLSPNAQEAARSIQTLLPQLDTLKMTVQDALFAGFGEQIANLSSTYLPMFQTVMSQMAASANTALTRVSEALQSPISQTLLTTLTSNSAVAFDTLTQSLQPLTSSFVTIGAVGSQFLPQLAEGAQQAALAFATMISETSASGELATWIGNGLDALKQLGSVVGNIGSAINGVFNAGQAVGGGLINSLDTITGKVAEFVNSTAGQNALQTFFASAQQALSALAPILATVGESVFGTILPAFLQLGVALGPTLQSTFTILADIMTTLQPVLVSLAEPISNILNALGPALLGAIQGLVPGIQPLATAFSSLITAIAPLLPHLGQIIGTVVSSLAPALTTWFNAMAPVVQQVITALQPAMDALAPTLQQLATLVGDFLVQSFEQFGPQIGPLVQNFSELVAAVMPLIPPLMELALATIPQITQVIMTWFLPAMTKATEIMTHIANAVVPPLSAVISAMATVWETAFGAIKSVVQSVWDFVEPIFNKFIEAIDKITGGLGALSSVTGIDVASPQYSGAQVVPSPAAPGTYEPLANDQGTQRASTAVVVNPNYAGLYTPPVSSYVAPAPAGSDSSSSSSNNLADETNLNTGAIQLSRYLSEKYPELEEIGGWRASDPYPDHPSGNALDIMIPDWNTPEGKALGDEILRDIIANADAFGLDSTIWQDFWKPVDGQGHLLGRTGQGPTQAHMDHIHALTNPEGGTGMPDKGYDYGYGYEPPSGTRSNPTYVKPSDTNDFKSDFSQLGNDFMGGIMEFFGFDGTLFKNPADFGLMKIASAVMGLGFNSDQQGNDGSMIPTSGDMTSGLFGLADQFMPSADQFVPSFAGPADGNGGGTQAGAFTADFRGANFGYSPQGVQNQIQSAQLPYARQGLRNTPK